MSMTTGQTRGDITQLLVDWCDGQQGAEDRLIEQVYPQLRKLAAHLLQHRGSGATLQVTELVHETYLKLIDQQRVSWQNRAHFFAIVSRLLRRSIVDHVRKRSRAKRNHGVAALPLDEVTVKVDGQDIQVLALDQALERLGAIDPMAARVVELRYFAGLTHDEVAEALGIGRATVGRSWRFARAWLAGHLEANLDD